MAKYTDRIGRITQQFTDLGIDTRLPGFYDHPLFIREETRDNEFLSNYARFVAERPYDPEYLSRARAVVPEVASIVSDDTRARGRLGDCVATALALSKILDVEGIWNYTVNGSVKITADEEHSVPIAYFYHVDITAATLAHAWVVAPPFAIVDGSLKYQPYLGDHARLAELLPQVVISEQAQRSAVDPLDVFSPEVRAFAAMRGVPTSRLFHQLKPHLVEYTRRFPPREVEAHGIRIKYPPCATTAEQASFNEMYPLGARPGYYARLHREVIQPRLEILKSQPNQG